MAGYLDQKLPITDFHLHDKWRNSYRDQDLYMYMELEPPEKRIVTSQDKSASQRNTISSCLKLRGKERMFCACTENVEKVATETGHIAM